MKDLDIIYPGMLRLYSDCPLKFYWRYKEQLSVPILDKNFSVGKNLHALASYYLKNENIDKFEAVLTEKEREFWLFLKSNKYFNYSNSGVERNIISRIGEYWIGGRIDAIMRDSERFYILDYKTGGVKDDMIYDFQTMVYCLLFESYTEGKYPFSFIYLDLKNKREVRIDYNQILNKEYKDRILKLCDDMENFSRKNFTKPQKCVCEYAKICE